MIPYLEKEIRKIKKEGRQEGIQEGRMEGIQEGRQEGRQEERAKMAVAMSRKGYSMEAIMDLTGFSEEEIHNLLQKAAH